MKLTAFFLLIGCLQLSARADGQQVTLKVEDVPLRVVFREIQKQTGLNVMIDEKLLKKAGKVSINVSQTPVAEVLTMSLRNEPLAYTISNGRIVIKSKETRETNAPIIVVVEEEPTGIKVSGRIVNEKGEPVVATVQVKGNKNKGTTTNEQGYFTLEDVEENAVLLVSGVSIETFEIKVSGRAELGAFTAQTKVQEGDMVVVNTGYQAIPRERATGSFVQLDEKLINRRVSTNILDRIEDVSPGVIFNRQAEENDPISIRGRSTINANTRPLIVVDNFPYDGEVENINPNDVESITILKDAAAASIWGAQAANGVIVIKTKRGQLNQKPEVVYNSNVTFGEKPDLFYPSQMSISDFIDFERELFNAGHFTYRENMAGMPSLSPVVEALIAQRDGQITDEEAEARIRQYKQQDTRREIDKYLNRTSINQQHAISVRGGTANHSFNISFGYDRNVPTAKGQENNRITLGAVNNLFLLDRRLRLQAGVFISRSLNRSDRPRSGYRFYPYERFTDDNGQPRFINYQYRVKAVENIEDKGLLNWQYSPLNEIGKIDDATRIMDYRINTTIGYKITEGLEAEVLYQYWQNQNQRENYSSQESYFARDLINTVSSINPDGSVNRPVPLGGIMALNVGNNFSHQLRGQLNYVKQISDDHHIVALAGAEVKHLERKDHSNTFYGYDPEYGTSQPVDNLTRFPQYFLAYSRTISNGQSHSHSIDRFVSYYANAAYTFRNKYVLSASARKDASNLFGVRTNQKGVPLWSTGISWNIGKEGFYNSKLLPRLKLRATYGFNGNVDKSLSAFTTARYLSGSSNYLSGLPFARIINPENQTLRWEKVGVLNFGIDFGFAGQSVSGSIEYFSKNAVDLIGDLDFAPQTGISSFRGNFANMRTSGIDFSLHSFNIKRALVWETDFFFSYINERVTSYDREGSVSQYIQNGFVPLEGKPLHAVYSYHWAGLDPNTGDPRGFLNGVESNNYQAVMNAYTPSSLRFHGAARPRIFGAFRNTFTYKNLSISANISYRLNYHFRRSSIGYSSLINRIDGSNISHGDYSLRWQKPGDEAFTQVPSVPDIFSTTNSSRASFYYGSSVLVERGDHIRLQDIQINYSLLKRDIPWLPVSQIDMYSYINNLGIIWKQTDQYFDPDFETSKPIRTIAIGLKASF